MLQKIQSIQTPPGVENVTVRGRRGYSFQLYFSNFYQIVCNFSKFSLILPSPGYSKSIQKSMHEAYRDCDPNGLKMPCFLVPDIYQDCNQPQFASIKDFKQPEENSTDSNHRLPCKEEICIVGKKFCYCGVSHSDDRRLYIAYAIFGLEPSEIRIPLYSR